MRQLNPKVALVATAMMALGCALNHHPDMRAQLDQLPIPGSYQLLGERATDPYPTLWGRDTSITRYYRSPLDFEETCAQLQAVLKAQIGTRGEHICSMGLKAPSGWRAGILWASPYSVGVLVGPVPAAAGRGSAKFLYPAPPDAFTLVTVTIHDRS